MPNPAPIPTTAVLKRSAEPDAILPLDRHDQLAEIVMIIWSSLAANPTSFGSALPDDRPLLTLVHTAG